MLKADGRTSKYVGLITDMIHISVNHWVKRFKSEGISLRNKPGQGRKPILDSEDKENLLETVKAHRQRVQVSKLSGKPVVANPSVMLDLSTDKVNI